MDTVEEVAIDSDGVFKYILIELTEKKKSGKTNDHSQPRKKTVVRGFEWAEFHGEIKCVTVILVCVSRVKYITDARTA